MTQPAGCRAARAFATATFVPGVTGDASGVVSAVDSLLSHDSAATGKAREGVYTCAMDLCGWCTTRDAC